MTGTPERRDDAQLLRRRDTAELVGGSESRRQSFIGEVCDLCTGQRVACCEANRIANMLRDVLIVAGDDIYAHAQRCKFLKRMRGAFLRRVEEQCKSPKRQICFVTEARMIAIRRDVAPCNAKRPKALTAEFCQCVLCLLCVNSGQQRY